MRLKVIDVPKTNKTISFQQMLPGQFGVIRSAVRNGSIVLRTYDELVVLDDPGVVWSINFSKVLVEVLPPGTKIELTSEI